MSSAQKGSTHHPNNHGIKGSPTSGGGSTGIPSGSSFMIKSSSQPVLLNNPSTPSKSPSTSSANSTLTPITQSTSSGGGKHIPMSHLFSQANSKGIQVSMDPSALYESGPPRMWQDDLVPYHQHHHIHPTQQHHGHAHHHSSTISGTQQSQQQHHPLSSTNLKHESKIDVSMGKSDLCGLDMANVRIRTFPPSLCNFTTITELRLEFNHLQHIPSSIGQMRCLMLLDLSHNQLSYLPPEIGKLTNLRHLLLYNNLLSTLPPEMGYLFNLELIGLEGNPIMDPNLQAIYMQNIQNPIGIISFLRDQVLQIETPAERLWHPVEFYSAVPMNVSGGFTVFTYNILAEKYATPQLYGYAPSWALSWEYRKVQLLNEILSYDPDIICLQEVEMGQFEQFFRQNLRINGYEGVYSPKSKAKVLADWERNYVDGCAIFYKVTQFRLEDKHTLIEFNQSALAKPSLRKHKDVYNRVMTRDNIAIVAKLEHIKTHRPVLVGNCHIHWDPQFADVKLVQTIMMMEELERLCDKLPPSGAVVLCGDFNSLPDSGVCEYLSAGHVPSTHPDFHLHQYEPYTIEGARHRVNLRNAYSLLTEETELESGATPFTNFTSTFCGTIDYIWYRPNTLSVTGLLGSLPTDYVKQLVGLPSQHYSSDHVSLLAEFKFEPAASPPMSTTTNVTTATSFAIGKGTTTSMGGNTGTTVPMNVATTGQHIQPPPLPSSYSTVTSSGSGTERDSEGRRMYSRNKSVIS